MAQLMPLPLTVSCFSKIQIGFTFLVPAHPGSHGKRAVKRVCVCVCVLCILCRQFPPSLAVEASVMQHLQYGIYSFSKFVTARRLCLLRRTVTYYFSRAFSKTVPSVLWRSWLGGRKGIRPVKIWVVGCCVVFCLEQGAHLHMAQLMPLPLTISCFSKIQIGFTFLVPADPGSPGKRAVKRVCVCVPSLRPAPRHLSPLATARASDSALLLPCERYKCFCCIVLYWMTTHADIGEHQPHPVISKVFHQRLNALRHHTQTVCHANHEQLSGLIYKISYDFS